jgi:hypothetical protein
MARSLCVIHKVSLTRALGKLIGWMMTDSDTNNIVIVNKKEA